jgi:ParB-like chromosome segregation protein Spo0J
MGRQTFILSYTRKDDYHTDMATIQKGRKVIEKKNVALNTLKIEYASVASITPNSYNPNRQSDHDFELLIHSMSEDGFTQPIVCQHDRTIVDGEHRWTASIVLHYLEQNHLPLTPEHIISARYRRLEIMDPKQEIPVVFVDMTPEQMRIATLRHNRARGEEDIDLTAKVLADLRELGALDWAADSLMLSDVEIERLLEDIPAPEDLAAPEYAQAWEPNAIHQEEVDHASTEVREFQNAPNSVVHTAMSAQAVDAVREHERRIAAARSEEERVMVNRDTNFFRINLLFNGDEAKVVKTALGNQPAETILSWCREHQQTAAAE